MSKFQVGDIVFLKKLDNRWTNMCVGDMGEVMRIESYGMGGFNIAVEFYESDPMFHSCSNRCKNQHGWWCSEDMIEKVGTYGTELKGAFNDIGKSFNTTLNILPLSKFDESSIEIIGEGEIKNMAKEKGIKDKDYLDRCKRIEEKIILYGEKADLKSIEVIIPNKVVKLTFLNNVSIKFVRDKRDEFSLEKVLYLAIAKKLYGRTLTIEGLEYKIDHELKYNKKYIRTVKNGLKMWEAMQELEKEKADHELVLEQRRKKRWDKKQKQIERCAAKKKELEDAEKERQIEIQKEAYVRAMQEVTEMEKESGKDDEDDENNEEKNNKLKINTKVRVRTDLQVNKLYGPNEDTEFVDDMCKYMGKIVTIDECNPIDDEYRIKEDYGDWIWTYDMFEGVEDNETIKKVEM